MKEFLLIFRNDAAGQQAILSPEQMQARMKPWQDWMGSIAAQDKLVSPGNRLEADGRVIKPDNFIINGPFVEIKESIGGYIIIKATTIDEATELSKDCPILKMGGNVEIRALVSMDFPN